MDGDIAPLPQISELAKKYKAMVMVDDAHATGILGKHGGGTVDHFNLEGKVDIIMGTFSKSLASIGGFIAGTKEVIHWIQHFARPFIFSASLPAANVAPVLAALEIIREEPERVEKVNRLARRMRAELQALGYNTGNSQTPIIPIVIGDDEKGFMLWKLLREEGIFTTPVIYPAVPQGQALIRTSYGAGHTDEELDAILAAFEKCGKALGII